MQYSWFQWRASVIAIIHYDFGRVLSHLTDKDIDWAAWRPLFEAGSSPQFAVDPAFLRDLRRSASA
jgi:hypothetical protein